MTAVENLNPGDRVRVTYEGVFDYADKLFGAVVMADNGRRVITPPGSKLKRLSRAPLTVGSVVEKRKHLRGLPLGSVVTNRRGYPMVTHDGYLRHLSGGTYSVDDSGFPEYAPYTVIYIPPTELD